MKRSKWIIAGIGLAISATQYAGAAELQPDTLSAWNTYLNGADLHLQERLTGRQPFLWMDESPDRAARVRRGEVVIAPVVGHGTESVPHGLLHHWIGAIFIPGASIETVYSVVQDYNDYQRIYRPAVVLSKTLACTDTQQEFRMVWHRHAVFVNAAIDGRYQAHDVMLGAHRGYGVAVSVQVREIERYGHTDQRLLPPDTGNGYIWRIRSVARYEERDGGVYLELEAMALTRDIPASVAWLANPVVNHLSINSLTTTLRQTRDAVNSPRASSETLASCLTPAHGSSRVKAGGE